MRSIITTDDIKNMIVQMFRENDEQILIKDIDDGSETTGSLVDYLNIEFYSWQNKKDTATQNGYEDEYTFLNGINTAFGLVEVVSEDATESADMDNAEKRGRISFHIQADKASNLDYMINKVRNRYLGEPFTILNSYGEEVKAYFSLSIMSYDEEPNDTQIGYTLVTSCIFSLSYMTNALSYNDMKLEMSLDNGRHFYEMPLIQETWQMATSSNPLPTAERPDLTGQLVTTIVSMKTLSFFDFNKKLSTDINKIFLGVPARVVNNVATKKLENLNIPVVLKLTCQGNVYEYYDIIDNIQKVIQNNTYNITSMSLKTDADPKLPKYLYFDGLDGLTQNARVFSKDIALNNVENVIIGATIPYQQAVTNMAGDVIRGLFFIKSNVDCDIQLDFSMNENMVTTKIVHLVSGETTPVNLQIDLDNDITRNSDTFKLATTSADGVILTIGNTETKANAITFIAR